ncbi:MAG: adenine phosphoribosyltransferase [Dehalococcoidia bacterium]
MDLAAYIRDVPDFPIPGVLFRDITPLLADAAAFRSVVDTFADHCRQDQVDVIVGIESRGFIFGTPLAYVLGVPFVPVRKAGKLPAKRMSVEYALEYGTSQLDIHADALAAGQRAVIVDDLLATGGTAAAAAKLVELVGGSVQEFLFLVELGFLNGREKLQGYPITALITY